MPHAANLMLDCKQHFPVIRIDDVLESILMLIAFLGDQTLGSQLPMRARKVVDIHRDVMLVVRRKRTVGLAKKQILPAPAVMQANRPCESSSGAACAPMISE